MTGRPAARGALGAIRLADSTTRKRRRTPVELRAPRHPGLPVLSACRSVWHPVQAPSLRSSTTASGIPALYAVRVRFSIPRAPAGRRFHCPHLRRQRAAPASRWLVAGRGSLPPSSHPAAGSRADPPGREEPDVPAISAPTRIHRSRSTCGTTATALLGRFKRRPAAPCRACASRGPMASARSRDHRRRRTFRAEGRSTDGHAAPGARRASLGPATGRCGRLCGPRQLRTHPGRQMSRRISG